MRRRAFGALLAVTIAAGASAQHRSARHEIARLRADSNTAIAAHDFEAMRRSLADDFTILPGSSGAPFDIAAYRHRLAPTFADPAFVTYVRTAERVTVARNGKRAAEAGRWVGIWRDRSGETRLSGVYQATWIPLAGSWRLKNESFVSLNCTGERARCDKVF